MSGAVRPYQRIGSVRLAASLALLGLAILLWGGYGRGWRWTGFGHNATLWDWLHVLALPLALAVAPLWLRHRARLDRTRQAVLACAGAGFAILVALGYGLDLRWTGFPGNRLWDWLELLVLPLTVALLPVWAELSGGVRRRHVALASCALAALGVAIVGGYGYHWRWTGFQGNTVFDWLQLFVAPLVLPVVLIPLIGNWMVADVVDARPAEGVVLGREVALDVSRDPARGDGRATANEPEVVSDAPVNPVVAEKPEDRREHTRGEHGVHGQRCDE